MVDNLFRLNNTLEKDDFIEKCGMSCFVNDTNNYSLESPLKVLGQGKNLELEKGGY